MWASGKFLFSATLVAFTSAGCCFHADLTKTADVQHSGILGQRLRTEQEMVLLKDKHSRTFQLVPKGQSFGSDSSQLAVVEAGTTLQINHVIKVTELCAWMWFPVYFNWECMLAKVEDGHFAGKEIAVAGEGMSVNENGGAIVLGSHLLHPINEASMVSALYNIHTFYPPPPAKYVFYDSQGHEFATVTLILPTPFFPEKLDGMWFGSLDSSYVRPKDDYVHASDKLNVHSLHPLIGYTDLRRRPLVCVIDLNPDMPDDKITLFMPILEKIGPVTGHWNYATDGGEVESGTFFGPLR
jgi:hypothetical protein